MTPSSAQVAENLRKHAESMAREIARRVAEEANGGTKTISSKDVERIALVVLLDWYLGDWLSG